MLSMIPVIMQIISEHHAQYSESTYSDSSNFFIYFYFWVHSLCCILRFVLLNAVMYVQCQYSHTFNGMYIFGSRHYVVVCVCFLFVVFFKWRKDSSYTAKNTIFVNWNYSLCFVGMCMCIQVCREWVLSTVLFSI